MPTTSTMTLPDTGIYLINSLGGPPLPTGTSATTLKVILENRAAAQAPMSSFRIAAALAGRQV